MAYAKLLTERTKNEINELNKEFNEFVAKEIGIENEINVVVGAFASNDFTFYSVLINNEEKVEGLEMFGDEVLKVKDAYTIIGENADSIRIIFYKTIREILKLEK